LTIKDENLKDNSLNVSNNRRRQLPNELLVEKNALNGKVLNDRDNESEFDNLLSRNEGLVNVEATAQS
jgi:hypothetical protein